MQNLNYFLLFLAQHDALDKYLANLPLFYTEEILAEVNPMFLIGGTFFYSQTNEGEDYWTRLDYLWSLARLQ